MKDRNALDKYATSATLIERVKNNDQDAWIELATLYQPLLEYWINKYSNKKYPIQDSDAQDIIQKVWIGVQKSFSRFLLKTGRRSFRPWIHKILWRRLADFARKEIIKKGKAEAGKESRLATDLVNDPDEMFSDYSDFLQEDDSPNELDGLIEADDEEEKAILVESAIMDVCRKTGIDERHLRVFCHCISGKETHAEIGERFDYKENNVGIIKHRVKKILNEIYGCFLD